MNNTQKQTILFVTNNYFPFSGGVVNSIEVLRQELEKLGYSIFIITLDFLGKKHNDPGYVIRVSCPIKFIYKKNHMAIPWRARNEINQYIQQIKPSLIHLHHPFLLGYNAAKIARIKNIPLVFTYHTQYEQYLHYVPLPRKIVAFYVRRRIASFCDSVNTIIAPSKAIQAQLITYHQKIKVIPSSIASIFFEKPFSLKENKSKFELLIVSRFVKEKNIPFLLNMFSKLDQNYFSFKLVGFGAEMESLQRYAYNTLRLSADNVVFIEKPTKIELIRLYQQANLFIFASQSETQGLVLAEAMACGTPVITLPGPGQSDIVKDTINGFLVENREQMQAKIEYCFANKEQFDSLCARAWETAQQYKPEIMASQVSKEYQVLIEKNKKI